VTPRFTDTGSLRLPDSTICGFDDSPTQQYKESATPRLNHTKSQRLPNSTIRGVSDSPTRIIESGSRRLSVSPIRRVFFKKINNRLPVSVMQGVVDSPTQRYGKSATPPITNTESWGLPVSVIAGSRFSNTNISANSKPKSERLKM
jgi:hypothetical protein